MRINVYTEELPQFMFYNADTSAPLVEIVTAEYISSRTGQPMKNYGLRIYLQSAPELHFVRNPDGSMRDDDRSAVTFWCGSSEKNIFEFLDNVREHAYAGTLKTWHDKTTAQQAAAEKVITRVSMPPASGAHPDAPDSRAYADRCAKARQAEKESNYDFDRQLGPKDGL